MSIGFDRCVDFRYEGGYPPVEQALRQGTKLVRVISLPSQEDRAAQFIRAGIMVGAVYTGESNTINEWNNVGPYVMRNCSFLIIGNEPKFAYPAHDAAWPSGTEDDYVNVYNHVANVLVPEQHPSLPLLGAGFWAHDYEKWARVARRLPKLSGATVHVYPIATHHAVSTVRGHLRAYRDVRPDLPLICGEWTARGNILAWARTIDAYCEAKLWYGPGDPVHALEGTDEYGILQLARRL